MTHLISCVDVSLDNLYTSSPGRFHSIAVLDRCPERRQVDKAGDFIGLGAVLMGRNINIVIYEAIGNV